MTRTRVTVRQSKRTVVNVGRWLALWIACSFASSAQAGQLERDWIERMSMAMQGLNYIGSFVYIHDSDVEAMKYFAPLSLARPRVLWVPRDPTLRVWIGISR